MARDGVPLPATLSGNIVERLIIADEALLYLISGALEFLCDKEQLEQTGTLTVDDTKIALSEMLWAYYTEEPMAIEIGTIMMWPTLTAPPKWLPMLGQNVSAATYPELEDLLGSAGGFVNIPNMSGISPMGADTETTSSPVTILQSGGALTHTLQTTEIPSHNHGAVVSPTSPDANRALVSSGGAVLVQDSVTVNTGGGQSHNNLHPVRGLTFIIYAGH